MCLRPIEALLFVPEINVCYVCAHAGGWKHSHFFKLIIKKCDL